MFAFTGKYSERIFMHKKYRHYDGLVPDNMRLVHWEKRGAGSPAVYSMKHLSMLMESNQLWARKFSLEQHPDVVEAVLESISPDAHSLFGSELLFQLVNTEPESGAELEALHEAIDQLPPALLLRLPEAKLCEAKSYAMDALLNATWDSPERQAFLKRYMDWDYSVDITEKEGLAMMLQAVSQLKDLKALRQRARKTKRDCRYFRKELRKKRKMRSNATRHARFVKLLASFSTYQTALVARIKELERGHRPMTKGLEE